ncbi:MAG: polysaccharide pyruvyl transferase family protein, partial [Oscillospiraceae bacterium]
MGKIGTITFHWATNYGAIMQAYALQKYLKSIGKETEIIDYLPLSVNTIQKTNKLINREFSFFLKERKLNEFRKNELVLSKRRYKSNKSLFKCAKDYDAIICGSDQIWNESFTTTAERKTTLSYFLNFADNVKKIAYAVSFGTDKLSEKMKSIITPELEKFTKIGVRENTGKEILSDLNINSDVVLDPTLLLSQDDYNKLLENKTMPKTQKVFSYIIHNNQTTAVKISNYLKTKFKEDANDNYYDVNCGLYEWLYYIKNAEIVATNSFHGVVFSIIFNTPFIVVPVENSGMNDRVVTLLSSLGLEDRIVSETNNTLVDKLLCEKINWTAVE